ncbi:hypothetical protein ACTFIW_000468 [Dictyostelium discoideum]
MFYDESCASSHQDGRWTSVRPQVRREFLIALKRCSHPIQTINWSKKQRLRSIIPYSSRRQLRDFTLVKSSKTMKWKGNQFFLKLRLSSYNRCFRIRYKCHLKKGNKEIKTWS